MGRVDMSWSGMGHVTLTPSVKKSKIHQEWSTSHGVIIFLHYNFVASARMSPTWETFVMLRSDAKEYHDVVLKTKGFQCLKACFSRARSSLENTALLFNINMEGSSQQEATLPTAKPNIYLVSTDSRN